MANYLNCLQLNGKEVPHSIHMKMKMKILNMIALSLRSESFFHVAVNSFPLLTAKSLTIPKLVNYDRSN